MNHLPLAIFTTGLKNAVVSASDSAPGSQMPTSLARQATAQYVQQRNAAKANKSRLRAATTNVNNEHAPNSAPECRGWLLVPSTASSWVYTRDTTPQRPKCHVKEFPLEERVSSTTTPVGGVSGQRLHAATTAALRAVVVVSSLMSRFRRISTNMHRTWS